MMKGTCELDGIDMEVNEFQEAEQRNLRQPEKVDTCQAVPLTNDRFNNGAPRALTLTPPPLHLKINAPSDI